MSGGVFHVVLFLLGGKILYFCLLCLKPDPAATGPEYASASSLYGLLPCLLFPYCLLSGSNGHRLAKEGSWLAPVNSPLGNAGARVKSIY